MSESKKGLTPVQVQAPQAAHQTTRKVPGKNNTSSSRCATKLELVAIHLLENGREGISALSSLLRDHDLNPRNSISDMRNKHGIHIPDEGFDHQHSGCEKTRMKRYWLADRNQARKAAELVNLKRKKRGAEPLSREQIARYLAAIPTSEQPKPAA